jgi:hypothetical protein
MGSGAFTRGEVSADLALRPDGGESPKHGVVEPAREMALDDYRQALTSTQDEWTVDEE